MLYQDTARRMATITNPTCPITSSSYPVLHVPRPNPSATTPAIQPHIRQYNSLPSTVISSAVTSDPDRPDHSTTSPPLSPSFCLGGHFTPHHLDTWPPPPPPPK